MVPDIRPEAEQTVPIDRDERLGEAIEAYLELAEAGGPTDPEEFAKAYPDLGEDLVAALEGLALVQGLVGEANGPGRRLEEGRRVAGYRIVRELGRGGMGIVYEAVHVGLDRPVALKVLGTQAAPDSSGRRRFLNEAKTAAGLHHTHIVPVFDVGQVGGLCYYAMQRIEGSGLDRVLRIMRRDRPVAAGSTLGSGFRKVVPPPSPRSLSRPRPDDSMALSGLGDDTRSWGAPGDVGGGSAWRGREPVDQPPTFTPPRGSAYYRWVADVGRQAADALAHAHQRGVIHRDIKPSNLLVDARGMVWVADFGLARRLADPSQTQFDSLLGTPRYMSPEQARTGAIDGRADVYSLGATLYELVTLRPPFDGQSAAELIDQIKTREPSRPRKFDPKVPLDLETILLKALAKRPDDRYATADDLAEDLARFLAYEPVKARRIGPVGRMVRFAQRHPSLTAVSTTAAVLVLSTAAIAYVRVVRERDRAEQAQARTEVVNGQLKTANGQLKIANDQLEQVGRKQRATMVAYLEKSAANLSLSDVPDRRSQGLETLHEAAKMDPDPATLVKLRDRALAFLSKRDVQARPPIPTPGKSQSQHGLTFAANGKQFAALSERGELGIWDVDGRKQLDSNDQAIAPGRNRPANGPGGGRRGRPGELRLPADLRLAAAGEQVAVIAADGSGVNFHDPASPDVPVGDLPMPGYHVAALLASADGRHLLTVDRPNQGAPNRPGPPDRAEIPDEPRISLWDRNHREGPRATLTLPPSKPPEQPFAPGRSGFMLLAISPDGSKIAFARQFETEIALWDGEGQPLPPIPVQVNATALALGPAGLLAVAGNGGEIALWDLSTAGPKRMTGLGPHQSFITQLRFSPRDGSILAAAAMGGGVDLWDLSTHSMIAALPTREGVEDLAFSPDGRTLAAAQASSIGLWSVAEPVAQHVLPETGESPRSVAFGPDDRLAIASAESNTGQAPASPLRLWDGPGRCPVSLRAWDQVKPSSIGFDAQGRLIAVEPDSIRWFDPANAALVARLELPQLARMTDDHRGPRPDRREGPPGPSSKADRKGEGPPGPGVAFARLAARSPDGRTLIIQRSDGFSLWRESTPDDLALLKPVERPDGNFSRGPLVALDPGGSRIYYLSRLGDALNAQPIGGDGPPRLSWSIPVSQGTILAISRDGRTLAAAERSGSILLVDAAPGAVRETLPRVADDTSPIESLAFSPDGRTLAVGSREQIRLWAVAGKPTPIVRLPGHRASVRSLAFDAKGARLAGADEKTVKVWDLDPLHAELARLGLDW
jgi:eukaryotic-like serine/threonine-protein kinase